MKKFLSTAILIGLLGITTLAFLAGMNKHGVLAGIDCPGVFAAEVQDCPEDTLAMAIHHLSLYQSLFNSFTLVSVVQILVIAAVLIFIFLSTSALCSRFLSYLRCSFWRRFFFRNNSPHKQELIRWLALFVNSPTSI